VARIFLSYAREDEAQVRGVYRRLTEAGFDVWMDKINLLPGQRWQQEIPQAIRHSDFILIFFSKNSVEKRGYIQREFRLALDTLEEMPPDAIHTIPIRLDDCQIPEQFRPLQWSDLSEEGEFDRIVRALRLGMEQRQPMAPEPVLQPSPVPRPDSDHPLAGAEGRSVADASAHPPRESEPRTVSQPKKLLVVVSMWQRHHRLILIVAVSLLVVILGVFVRQRATMPSLQTERVATPPPSNGSVSTVTQQENFASLFHTLSSEDFTKSRAGVREFNALLEERQEGFINYTLELLKDDDQARAALQVLDTLSSLSILRSLKTTVAGATIKRLNHRDPRVRAAAADLLRFNGQSQEPDQPARALYERLSDTDPMVIQRALVAMEFNCKNISRELWGNIVDRARELARSDNDDVVNGALYFFGNVRPPYADDALTKEFLQAILDRLESPNSDRRWTMYRLRERVQLGIPLSEHQRVIDIIVRLVEIDRQITDEDLAELFKSLRGNVPKALLARAEKFEDQHRQQMDRFEADERKRRQETPDKPALDLPTAPTGQK
jgi:hypothetical protein